MRFDGTVIPGSRVAKDCRTRQMLFSPCFVSIFIPRTALTRYLNETTCEIIVRILILDT